MSKLIPGNQKHLTLDNRVFIEKSLDLDIALKDIPNHSTTVYLCTQR